MTELYDIADRFSQAMDEAYGSDRKARGRRAISIAPQSPGLFLKAPLLGAAAVITCALAYAWLRDHDTQLKENIRSVFGTREAA